MSAHQSWRGRALLPRAGTRNLPQPGPYDLLPARPQLIPVSQSPITLPAAGRQVFKTQETLQVHISQRPAACVRSPDAQGFASTPCPPHLPHFSPISLNSRSIMLLPRQTQPDGDRPSQRQPAHPQLGGDWPVRPLSWLPLRLSWGKLGGLLPWDLPHCASNAPSVPAMLLVASCALCLCSTPFLWFVLKFSRVLAKNSDWPSIMVCTCHLNTGEPETEGS